MDPSRETLEEGLGRELLEELGTNIPVSIEDHVSACYAPPASSSSTLRPLIIHFYVKKIDETQVVEVERAAVSVAADHGLEVRRVGATSPDQTLTSPLVAAPSPAGSGNGQSPALHLETKRRPPALPLARVHRQRPLPAGQRHAPP